MSFEEEFDSIIRQKSEEAAFPFDEANWAKAGAKLDAERNVAKINPLKKFYLPVLLVGMASLSFLLLSNLNENNAEQIAGAKQNTLDARSSASDQVVSGSLAAKPVPATDEINQNPEPVQEQANHVTANNSIPATVTSVAPEGKNAKTKPVNSASPISEIASNSGNTSTNIGNTSASDTNLNQEVPVDNTPQNTITDNHLPPSGIATNEAAKQSPEPAQNSGSVPETISAEVFQAAATQAQAEDVMVEQLHALNPYLAVEQTELIQLPFVLLQRYDEDYFKKLNKYKTHFITAEAGTFYNLGWQTSDGKDGKGFNWYGGINYGYYLNRQFAVSAGLQVFNIQNTKQAFYTVTNKAYGFGYTNTTTNISNNNLVYLSLPLRVYYSVNKTAQLGLGFNMAYALTAQSTVQTNHVGSEFPESKDAPVTVSGVYKGTNQTNMMLSVFYKYQFTRRFGLNAEFVYGLKELMQNNANVTVNDKPVGVRLGLQYTLFDK